MLVSKLGEGTFILKVQSIYKKKNILTAYITSTTANNKAF